MELYLFADKVVHSAGNLKRPANEFSCSHDVIGVIFHVACDQFAIFIDLIDERFTMIDYESAQITIVAIFDNDE